MSKQYKLLILIGMSLFFIRLNMFIICIASFASYCIVIKHMHNIVIDMNTNMTEPLNETNVNNINEKYMVNFFDDRQYEYGFLTHHENFEVDSETNILINGLKFDGLTFIDLVNMMKQTRQTKDYYIKYIDKIKTVEKLEYIYSVYTLICQKYLKCMGKEHQLDILPYHIGLIWYYSAKKLSIVPSTTYASVVLYNWKIKDTQNTSDILSNIDVLHSITNSVDELWFYKIHVAIEFVGATLVKSWNKNMNDYLEMENEYVGDVSIWDNIDVQQLMNEILIFLNKSSQLLKQMKEHCDPEFFWSNIRIYLSGYDDKIMYPNGLRIENTEIGIRWKGGSGAQSSLLQLIDIIMGISHSKHENGFLEEMKSYMPKSHQHILQSTQNIINKYPLKQWIMDKANYDMIQHFNTCLKELQKFRSQHIALVHTYVVNFIKKIDIMKKQGRIEEAKKLEKNNVAGNGGSGSLGKMEFELEQSSISDLPLVTFLKEFIDDVKDKKIAE